MRITVDVNTKEYIDFIRSCRDKEEVPEIVLGDSVRKYIKINKQSN